MKLKSRKFWVAIITAVVMLVSQLSGVELDPDQWATILVPVVAYILGESWVDARRSSGPGGP